MAINSLSTESAVLIQSQPYNAAASPDKSAKETPLSTNQTSNNAVQKSPLDTITDNITISPLEKQTPDKSTVENNSNSTSKSVGAASHVVVTYNLQGKVRTKFLDSRNNVVYQVPPEMLARIEDLMMKPETFTDIKG